MGVLDDESRVLRERVDQLPQHVWDLDVEVGDGKCGLQLRSSLGHIQEREKTKFTIMAPMNSSRCGLRYIQNRFQSKFVSMSRIVLAVTPTRKAIGCFGCFFRFNLTYLPAGSPRISQGTCAPLRTARSRLRGRQVTVTFLSVLFHPRFVHSLRNLCSSER